jgi:hypothetical protein
MLGNAGFLQTA